MRSLPHDTAKAGMTGPAAADKMGLVINDARLVAGNS